MWNTTSYYENFSETNRLKLGRKRDVVLQVCRYLISSPPSGRQGEYTSTQTSLRAGRGRRPWPGARPGLRGCTAPPVVTGGGVTEPQGLLWWSSARKRGKNEVSILWCWLVSNGISDSTLFQSVSMAPLVRVPGLLAAEWRLSAGRDR